MRNPFKRNNNTVAVDHSHPFHMHKPTVDYRGIPTLTCLCGSEQFYAVIHFDYDREIAGYLLDGLCCTCHALVTLPTPIDEEMYQ